MNWWGTFGAPDKERALAGAFAAGGPAAITRSAGASPVLRVRAQVVADVRARALEASPRECCGLLLAREGGPVETAWPVRNEAREPRRGFAFAPEGLLEAELRAAACGLAIVGVYHSHPRHDACPSAGDAAMAAPSWVYLIVGGRAGRLDAVRFWRCLHGGGFAEEAWLSV